jgi:hypothetical protein
MCSSDFSHEDGGNGFLRILRNPCTKIRCIILQTTTVLTCKLDEDGGGGGGDDDITNKSK